MAKDPVPKKQLDGGMSPHLIQLNNLANIEILHIYPK